MEAFKFNTIVQKERQTFTEFETELRTQVQHCDYICSSCNTSFANRMLRDRIIMRVQDKKLQVKLLDGRDQPLSKIVEVPKVFEAVAENKLILDRRGNMLEVKSLKEQPVEEKKIAAVTRKQCYNCGAPFSQNHRLVCPAVKAMCFDCGGTGHFRKCCRRKKVDNRKPPTKHEQQG
uniref:CCHC-type domain-containing protein n=1 Tax=Anopheles atroparvus TaxID=41427 RepID=A0AAG5DPZ1_ANOAO